MSQERVAKKTPADAPALFTKMCEAWWALFNAIPGRESIILLMSQWALETGYGKAMWNFNLGNVKAKVGGAYDWCFFRCNEILSKAQAESLQARSPGTTQITKYRPDGKCIIWFYPKHSACCFRSFETLGDGVTDHLQLMYKRFNKAWPAVLLGDPTSYCHALKLQGYYTADEIPYTAGVTRIFDSYLKSLANVQMNLPPPTEITRPTLNSATDFRASPLQVPKDEEESLLWSPYSVELEDKS